MTRQQTYNARAARSLRNLRQIAKDFGYSVGGHGGSEIDDFMDAIESGKVIITQAIKVELSKRKEYFNQPAPPAVATGESGIKEI